MVKADDSVADLKARGYLTCGQFAKLCQVKKQTLFHYDDIGLLAPEHVDEKGYRFYSYSQYGTFAVISSLKEAGLSLSEIKGFLEKGSSTSRLDTLKSAYRRIEEKIAYLEQVREAVGFEIDRAEEAETLYTDEITILQLPRMEMIRSVDLSPLDDADLISAVKLFASTVEVVCAALDTASIREGDFEHYEFMLAFKPAIPDAALERISRSGPRLMPYTRREGPYVVAYHKGPIGKAGETYGRILAFCDAHGLRLGRYAFEEYLRNELTAADEADHLMRICIQVLS